MRKIAILNFKGGTGKTATAVNLSHALALRRQNVLVVDCDPQGSVADWQEKKDAHTGPYRLGLEARQPIRPK